MIRTDDTPIICALNHEDYNRDPVVNGVTHKRGLIPRDYERFPVGCYESAPAWIPSNYDGRTALATTIGKAQMRSRIIDPTAGGVRAVTRGIEPVRSQLVGKAEAERGVEPVRSVSMPLIPRSEWAERIRDMEASKTRLSDLRRTGDNGNMIDALDQDGVGYCWNHSVTMAVILTRVRMGQKYVRLSAFSIGCIIKSFQDEGGWGAEALDFAVKRGIVPTSLWPEKSMQRSLDNPKNWEEAAKYKVTEGFIDLAMAVYDRNLTFDQVMTLLLCRIPVIGDFNWWSHSVCLMDPVNGASRFRNTRMASGKLATFVEFNRIWDMDNQVTAGFGVRLLNSWTNDWEDQGEGILSGDKAVTDGAVAPCVALAA